MDDTGFRLLLGIAGVAFGAIQLYFRSERKQLTTRIDGLERRATKLEYDVPTLDKHLTNLFNAHVVWTQKEFKEFMEKCEGYREKEYKTIAEVNGNTRVDQNEIIKINGKIDLLEERFGKVEQFFYEGRALWDTKAEMLGRLDMLENSIKELKVKDTEGD